MGEDPFCLLWINIGGKTDSQSAKKRFPVATKTSIHNSKLGQPRWDAPAPATLRCGLCGSVTALGPSFAAAEGPSSVSAKLSANVSASSAGSSPAFAAVPGHSLGTPSSMSSGLSGESVGFKRRIIAGVWGCASTLTWWAGHGCGGTK